MVFVAEDDLWTVAAGGGVARRLTTALSDVSGPWLSPDGGRIAFVAREEGAPEVYVVDADGGVPRQLTHLGAATTTSGWSPDGRVAVCSDARAPFGGQREVYLVPPDGGEPERQPWGPAQRVAFGPGGRLVLGRNVGDPARWKRYRGGTAGEFWVDPDGGGRFSRWTQPRGNLASPMWIGERIYFLCDHEGVGNLYSCRPDGVDLHRHTDHADYYARNAQTDGRRIVYHAGGDLYLYDPETDSCALMRVELKSQRTQRARRFVDAAQYLDGMDLHPRGHSLLITSRGRAFAFGNWEGPVLPAGEEHGVRYRLARWLPDGRRVVMVADAGGEEALEIHRMEGPGAGGTTTGGAPVRRLEGLDIGRAVDVAVAPRGDCLAVANHRNEVLVVELTAGTARLLERNAHGTAAGMAWSPDGRWLCYAAPLARNATALRLWRAPEPPEEPADAEPAGDGGAEEAKPATGEGGEGPSGGDGANGGDANGGDGAAPQGAAQPSGEDPPAAEPEPALRDCTAEPVTITRPVLHDVSPAFDPDGRYLYFLSYRTFNPIYDNLQFDLGFPRGVKPYLLTLRADLPSPFLPAPRPLIDDGKEDGGRPDKPGGPAGDAPAPGGDGAEGEGAKPRPERKPEALRIDLEGIADRVLALPLPEGRYGGITAIKDKVLFSVWPVEGSLGDPGVRREHRPRGTLEAYDLKELRAETLVRGMNGFRLALDGKTMVYRAGDRLRVVVAGKRREDGPDGEPGRRSGWVALGRVRVAVDPAREWAQMLREAWRLQRDNFWTPDMSGVDWPAVWERYSRLLPRVASRGELSDLMWEMQGELGTSHAYEMGGDYRPGPSYGHGHLGADLAWDAAAEGYRITHIVRGDGWLEGHDSPLRTPGVGLSEGELVVAVDGRPVTADVPVGALLVGKAGAEVALTVRTIAAAAASEGDGDPAEAADGEPDSGPRVRTVVVRTVGNERRARYREWVEANRAFVHEASRERLGYIHIPDMGPRGYAEFHRAWLAEARRDGLVVDVRHNGGGHVSQLILEKLARRPVGYDLPRWGQPEPYPAEAVAGPLVAICDEHAGSDGDIFSHCFKRMKLGPLVGRRTWGGVIGIWVRHPLVDGTHTSQPEFAFWFPDVGWGVENYGTDPDIEVDNRPEDWAAGVDAQLRRGVDEALAWLAERPPERPSFGDRPSRAVPPLPPRG